MLIEKKRKEKEEESERVSVVNFKNFFDQQFSEYYFFFM